MTSELISWYNVLMNHHLLQYYHSMLSNCHYILPPGLTNSPWSFSARLACMFASEISPPGTFYFLKMCMLLSVMQTGSSSKVGCFWIKVEHIKGVYSRQFSFWSLKFTLWRYKWTSTLSFAKITFILKVGKVCY